jgi:uncharacterized membrane protein YbjE (DUF340 family)
MKTLAIFVVVFASSMAANIALNLLHGINLMASINQIKSIYLEMSKIELFTVFILFGWLFGMLMKEFVAKKRNSQ